MSVQLVSPVLELMSVSTPHPTSGLTGYPAHDWFARAGSLVLSPIAGHVRRLSGSDPSSGPQHGPHGPFGWSLYLVDAAGNDWYLTHLGMRVVRTGDVVHVGTRLGTVANWGNVGTPPHVHMGVRSP
jgi:hypothetical protein